MRSPLRLLRLAGSAGRLAAPRAVPLGAASRCLCSTPPALRGPDRLGDGRRGGPDEDVDWRTAWEKYMYGPVERRKEWDDMPLHVQRLWKRLGWTKYTWGAGPNPPSDSKSWADLGDDEREAAEALKYTRDIWENEDGNPFEEDDSGRAGRYLALAMIAFIPIASWLDNRKWAHVECSPEQRSQLRALLVKCERNLVLDDSRYTALRQLLNSCTASKYS